MTLAVDKMDGRGHISTARLLLIKLFITTALEYKVIVELLKQFVCCATHFLVMHPYSCDFL